MYCPKCGVENNSEVRFCRKCGAELEAVAALIDGRLVVSDSAKPNGFFSEPSWEKALVPFFFGVAIMIASFILGFDPNTGEPRPWLAFLFLAFPIIGFGIAQIIKVSNKEKEKGRSPITVRAATPGEVPGVARKELSESRTDYVSPDEGADQRTPDLVPASVVEGTTRHLEMDDGIETNELPDQKPDDA